MVSNSSKMLLRNVIRHTDTHNRIREETDMWQTHRMAKERHGRKRHRDSSPQPRCPHPRGPQSSSSKIACAHMDRDSSPDIVGSLYWKRKLQEVEEKDPDRWGHAGYKELYPEQFLSSSESSSSSERHGSKAKSKRKKEQKHHKSKKHKHKGKKSKKHKSKDKESQYKSKDKESQYKSKDKESQYKSKDKESQYVWVAKSVDTSTNPVQKH